MKNQTVISARDVDRIIDAVAGVATIPERLDRKKLGRDLDRACFWYRVWKALSSSQPWGDYLRRGKHLIKSGPAAFSDLWGKDDAAGKWWREQLKPFSPSAMSTEALQQLISKLMAERLTSLPKSRWLRQQRIKRPARWVLEPDGSESPTAWLVGGHLAKIFTSHFLVPATARQYRTIRKGGEILPGKVSPYVAFVLAVFKQLGINNRDGRPFQIETVVTYRKKSKSMNGLDNISHPRVRIS